LSFLDLDPPNKGFQIATLKRIFKSLNPNADPQVIDFELLDDHLTIKENLDGFAVLYPEFKWQVETPEEIEKKTLKEQLQENIEFLEFATDNIPNLSDEDRASLHRTIEDLGKRAVDSVSLQRTVARLRKELVQAKTVAEKNTVLNEIVPVGKPRTVQREQAPPPPPAAPTTAPSRPQEQYAKVLGDRILNAKNLLDVLGVQADNSDDQVRAARNQLLLLYHPDVFRDTDLGTTVAKKINEAYDTLKTRELRDRYLQTQQPFTGPTTEVAYGRPVVYCLEDQMRGLLVMMKYDHTVGFKTGRSYDIYKCPSNPLHKDRIGNYVRGEFIGFGK